MSKLPSACFYFYLFTSHKFFEIRHTWRMLQILQILHGGGYKYCKSHIEDATNIANITWRRPQIFQISHGGCYKYCKYCATGSFANILPCQILFHSGVPNCVTSKKASESFDLIALGKCNKFHSSHALQYQ